MSRLMRATEIVGLPVVTLGGDDVAEIRDVVYDPGRGGLRGFTLNKRGFLAGRLKDVLTSDAVHAVGRDAVMVRSDDDLTDRGDAPDAVASPDSERAVTGVDVVTQSGTSLGRVVDVVIRVAERAEAVGYELVPTGASDQRAFIPLPDQTSVSGDALVVPDRLEGFVHDDLSGFGGAIDAYRQDHDAAPTPRHAGGTRRSGARSGASKDELYAEAKRRDIRGRSTMTKAQLASALSEGGSR